MKKPYLAYSLAALLLATFPLGASEAPLAFNAQPADEPNVRIDWIFQHQIRVKHLREQKPDVVLLGDSITAGWARSPVFAEKLKPLKAFNAGIGGDSTQHVLWRVTHGAVETQPKIVVLLIGINNLSNGYTTEQVESGINAIIRLIQERSPATRIVLMGILPRDEKPDTPARQRVAEVNERIAKLHDGKTIHFLDIGQQLLEADGTLSKETAPDGLHLGPRGYEIWGEALHPLLTSMLAETAPAAAAAPSDAPAKAE